MPDNVLPTSDPDAVGILATGSWLPERVITNEELAASLGVTAAWIEHRTGVVERRVADAADVIAQLRIAMLSGPVIASADGGWWTFLTEPAAGSRPTVAAELWAHNVRLTPRGAHVIIPAPAGGDGLPRWLEAPQARRPLPPWPAVIATTRRVVDHVPALSQRVSTLDESREVAP